MKTIDEILLQVRQHKTCSRPQLYRYLKTLGIRRVGELAQRPARYPEDTASRIIAGLGLAAPIVRLVSMRELRAERARAKAAKKAKAP